MMVSSKGSGWIVASVVGLTTLLSVPAHAAEPDEVQKEEVVITEEARQHFRAGVNLLNDPDGARYEEAYRQFQAAYAASPSWKILGNLGITAMKLERDGEAIDAFEKYLAQGGDDLSAEERAQFERDLETLKAGVATLDINSVPDGAKIIDRRAGSRGATIVNQYGPVEGTLSLRVRPGVHRIVARVPGYEDATWEVDVAPGSTHTHTFELQQPTAAATPATTGAATAYEGDAGVRPIPTSVYIGLAATGALAVGAGVTGILALGKNGDFDDANDGSDPSEAEDLRDETKDLNLVTDIMLGGAVVAGAVTAVLYFTRPTVKPEPTALQVTPVVGRDAGALVLSGAF